MGTVKGDVHDIGKNLVNIMLEGAGFTVHDLGVNVAPEKFVEQVQEHQPDIVGFSAFLTTTMPMFKANINALEKAGIRDQVIVMVGGAPVTQEYADAVGADGYAADASTAVRLAKDLIERRAHRRGGLMSALAAVEHALKGPVFGLPACAGSASCTRPGMTCPMTCPKELRNGPCGGVRPDGGCEVMPGDALRLAEGVRALARACPGRTHFDDVRPPVDNRLWGTSSWRNLVTGRDKQTPAGWPA